MQSSQLVLQGDAGKPRVYVKRHVKRSCSTCVGDSVPGQRHCLKCHATYMRKWRKNHPLSAEQKRRASARASVRVYIRRGKMTEGKCEKLGSDCRGRIEAHHADYTKPRSVIWFCRKHHVDLTFGRS